MMGAPMQVVQHLDEDAWMDFVANHPRGNIFHTPEMFRVFAQTKGQRPELWAVLDGKAGVLALLTPVNITLLDGWWRRLTTRSVAYGSILAQDTAQGQQALRLLLDTYARHVPGRSLFTELRNLHDVGPLRPLLERCGYVYHDHLNYLVDLDRPVAAILQSIGRRTRKKIRKGLRDERVRIVEVTRRAELAHWYAILQKTYHNAQVPLADRSLFEAAFDVLRPKRMAQFLLAQVAGESVACSVELMYKDTIYGWYGGSTRSYGAYLPNEMLIWHVLEWGAQQGYRVYDFGGAGRPDHDYGVRHFKAKFGGDLVNFGRHTCVHRPSLLKLSKRGYAIYKRFL